MSSGVTPFDLEGYLAAERHALEATRERISKRLLPKVTRGLSAPIGYALDAGGKRIRPIISLAAYRAVIEARGREPIEPEAEAAIYEIGVALEFIHTYSLIHDDLPSMDDDDLRRGRPTTHRVFGVPQAIVAGALLIPLSALALNGATSRLGLGSEVEAELMRALYRAAGAEGMVGGQWLDLAAEGREMELEALEGVHRRKTGALLSAAAELGGIAAQADRVVLRALIEYGQALGLAFQIADDILDLTGDQSTLGKAAGRDLSLGKATYPAILGVDLARQRALKESERAIAALGDAGLEAPALEALARHTVERKH